jgi:hypothetical protein
VNLSYIFEARLRVDIAAWCMNMITLPSTLKRLEPRFIIWSFKKNNFTIQPGWVIVGGEYPVYEISKSEMSY